MTDATPISAALLAGGKSSRMGRDKNLVEIDGRPLWHRQTALLARLSRDVMIAAPVRPAWLPSGTRWIADALPDQGPLGGLAAILAAAAHPRVLVLAVDLPGMTSTYLQALLAHSTPACGVVPIIDGLFQPLSAVYPRAARAAAAAHLERPDKSLQPLLRELIAAGKMRALPVAVADIPEFRNLNTAQD